MRRLAKLKLINIFLAAVLIFNQAAFLSVAVAQTTSSTYTYTYPYTYPSNIYPSTSTINTTPSTTYTAPTTNTTTISPNTTTYTAPTINTTTNTTDISSDTTTYTAPTTSTTNTTNVTTDTSSTDTDNLAPDGSTIIFEDIITDTLETPPLSILTISFISPSTKVSGQPHFPVTTSEPAEVVFYIYKDGAEINRFNAIDKGNNTYSFTWDSTSTSNGQYTIKAYGKKSGYIDASKEITITVENAIPTTTIDPAIVAVPSYYEITFVEAYKPPLSGERKITASLNKDVDSIYFSVEGPRNEKIFGTKNNSRQYYFLWNTSKFPDGYYKVTAEAMLAGQTKTSKSFSIQVINSITKTTPFSTVEKITSEKTTTTIVLAECKKNNINTQEECQKFMNIPADCRDKKILFQDECNKFLAVPPECRAKQILSKEECDKYMTIPPQCREKGIFDQEKCKKYSYTFSMPTECQKAGVTTPEECNKIIFLNSLPAECQKAKVTSKEECEKILKNQTSLTSECQQMGATTMEECNYALRQKTIDLNSLVKVETKPAEKVEYAEGKYEPTEECKKANISSPEECKKYMEIANAPAECRAGGISDKIECEKILFVKNAPKECLDANINTANKCEKYIFEKSIPTDCKEAGISTMEACKKYMFEKYNGEKNTSTENLPIDCQKAGVATSEECNKIMRTAYLPKACQDQGIKDEASCNLYMQQKNISKECQQAGVTSRSECDRVMFKIYGPKECLTAGIEDETECKNFMFNKYSQQVTCQNIDEWQCQNSIQERHLGNIVNTQTKFQELKDKVVYLAGESMTGEKLNGSLETAKNILPLTGNSANFKIIKTGEKMILDGNDNLTQTSPMALMIDTDQDGLPDDMEKIIGTDPNNADTDGDGYADGVELKNNYDPLGFGGSAEKLYPVAQAIIENKELEQPKTEGEVSENLEVETISNVSNKEGENEGYLFAGKAEANSVVTLYFYSDLPLIATVKTDEYGNWQYEFTQSLIDGEHEVYVAVNDNTGKITSKSNPLNFFVKEAKAASVKDFVSSSSSVTPQTNTEKLVKYYIIIATVIALTGILLFVSFIIQRKRTQS